MPVHSDIVYRYDGSFDGLLCCVFESYEQREIPLNILPLDAEELPLFPSRKIASDPQKAQRVLRSIPAKIGPAALTFVRHVFLTCLDRKELYTLLFLRLGYQHGPAVLNMLTNDVVSSLQKAVKHLGNESHLLKGFLRFSIINNVLVGEIEPKNYVLPLMATHFCERYPEEHFLIHDRTHAMALVYKPHEAAIIPLTTLELAEADEEEQKFRRLWQLFYNTIAIKERYNPRCRMTHMPKRYWQCMTEFIHYPEKAPLKLPETVPAMAAKNGLPS